MPNETYLIFCIKFKKNKDVDSKKYSKSLKKMGFLAIRKIETIISKAKI